MSQVCLTLAYDVAPRKWQTTTTIKNYLPFTVSLKFILSLPLRTNCAFFQHPLACLHHPLLSLYPSPSPHTLRGLIWQREKSQMNTNTLTDVSENLHVGLSVCAQTQILYYCCRSVLITHSCPQGTEGWLLFFAPSEAHNHLYSEEFA